MERRARMLATRRDELRGQVLRDRSMRKRQKESLSMMRQVVDVLKLLQNQQTDKLHDRLSQAGLRSRDAVVVFLFFKVATPVLLAAVTFLLVYLLEFGDLSPAMRLLTVLGAPCSASSCPSSTCPTSPRSASWRSAGPARRPRPSGDLRRVRTVARRRAGSGRQRDRRRQPELAEELSLTSIELGFLPERRQALLNLNRRTNLPSIRGVGEHADADREVRHAAVAVAARAGQRVPRSAAAEGGGEGGAPARDPDRADDRVHSAGAVHRPDRPGGDQGHDPPHNEGLARSWLLASRRQIRIQSFGAA